MKILILTYGSRGDIQPFLPLSLRLMDAGHVVKLAAPFRFRDLVEEQKIKFVPLAGDPEELSRRLNNAGQNFIRLLGELMNHTTRLGAEIWQQTEEASRDADLIIHTFLHATGGHTLARAKHIPDIHIQTFPMFTPTGDYPNITWPNWGWRTLNRFTHYAAARISWWAAQIGFARVWRRAGWQKQKLYWPFENDAQQPQTPVLCPWSPSVLPASSDWHPHVHVTGYYFLPSESSYQPPDELDSFLQTSMPPVCITFGSMVNRDAQRIDGIVREALEQTGNRGIILSGWSGVRDRSRDDLLYLEAASHAWLLPHCRMIIHHGGAGTTAAGLRAGIPNIVVPFMGDQQFWGRRVHAIGAGPRPVPVKALNVEGLMHAMGQAESKLVEKQAQIIGERIRNEDGTGEAVKWIEKYSNYYQSPD
jgi:sterol 3beta-glucosyltransferase